VGAGGFGDQAGRGTQGESILVVLTSPEDPDPAQIIRIHPACGVVESTMSGRPLVSVYGR